MVENKYFDGESDANAYREGCIFLPLTPDPVDQQVQNILVPKQDKCMQQNQIFKSVHNIYVEVSDHAISSNIISKYTRCIPL